MATLKKVYRATVPIKIMSGGRVVLDTLVNIEVPITPIAPTVIGNDTTNILTATHTLGASEIEFKIGSGAYQQYAGPINVGNNTYSAGRWQFRTKATSDRNASALAPSPAFTATTNTTPVPPTLIADDTANTLTVSHALGDSEILVSVNNGAYVPLSSI